MKNFFSNALLATFFILALAQPAMAGLNLRTSVGNNNDTLDSVEFGDAAGYDVTHTSGGALVELIGQIIAVFLGLLGVVFLGLIIYAGFKWMTAQGAEEDVKQAKQTIERAVVGLAIVLAAYAISYFVVAALQARTLST